MVDLLTTMAFESLRLLSNYLNWRSFEEITHGPSRQIGVNIAIGQFDFSIADALKKPMREMADEISALKPIGCYQLPTYDSPRSERATDAETHLSVRVRLNEGIVCIDAAFA